MSKAICFMYSHFLFLNEREAARFSIGSWALVYGVCVAITALLSIIHTLKYDEGTWKVHFVNPVIRATSVFIDALIGSVSLWIGSLIGGGWGITLLIILLIAYIACKIGFAIASLGDIDELSDTPSGFFYSIHGWLFDLNSFSEEIVQRKERYEKFVNTAKF